MKTIYLALLFLLFPLLINAQNIYPEKFSGCITDEFSLEKDSIIAKIDYDYFVKTIISNYDKKTKSKIKGVIKLQIIVNLDGSSCLMSVDNKTNIKTSKLNIKNSIDSNLIWNKPLKKCSPLIILKFNTNSVQFKRIGVDGNTGMQLIDEGEILIK